MSTGYHEGNAQDWAVRAETSADHGAIDRVNRLAFGGENEARLVRALREAPGYSRDLSLVADGDGQVVGHILFTPIFIRGVERRAPALALAPMAVLPDWQRRGVGSSMIREGIERCRRLGQERIVVLGHSDYYPRFGFVAASQFGIRAPMPVPDEAYMVLALRPMALAGCAGMVEYPPAFSEVT